VSVCDPQQQGPGSELKATAELLRQKDHLIAVEKSNASLQTESSLLKEQLKQMENQNSSLNSQMAALQRHASTLQEQNSALHTETAKLQVENSTVSSQSASLMAQNAVLQGQVTALEAEAESWQRQRDEAWRARESVLSDHERLLSVHERQAQEYETLISQHAALKGKQRALESEHRTLHGKYCALLQLKEKWEEQQKEGQEEQEELQQEVQKNRLLQQENLQLKSEVDRLTQNQAQQNQGLQQRLNELKSSLSSAQQEAGQWMARYDSLMEQHQNLDITMTKLDNHCELLSRLKGNLEEENHHLLSQINLLSQQNQTLLERSMESKELFHQEQKTYIDKLNVLRRQKEKLEEKIMDQYKFYDPTPKKRSQWSGAKALVKLIRPRKEQPDRDRARSAPDIPLPATPPLLPPETPPPAPLRTGSNTHSNHGNQSPVLTPVSRGPNLRNRLTSTPNLQSSSASPTRSSRTGPAGSQRPRGGSAGRLDPEPALLLDDDPVFGGRPGSGDFSHNTSSSSSPVGCRDSSDLQLRSASLSSDDVMVIGQSKQSLSRSSTLPYDHTPHRAQPQRGGGARVKPRPGSPGSEMVTLEEFLQESNLLSPPLLSAGSTDDLITDYFTRSPAPSSRDHGTPTSYVPPTIHSSNQRPGQSVKPSPRQPVGQSPASNQTLPQRSGQSLSRAFSLASADLLCSQGPDSYDADGVVRRQGGGGGAQRQRPLSARFGPPDFLSPTVQHSASLNLQTERWAERERDRGRAAVCRNGHRGEVAMVTPVRATQPHEASQEVEVQGGERPGEPDSSKDGDRVQSGSKSTPSSPDPNSDPQTVWYEYGCLLPSMHHFTGSPASAARSNPKPLRKPRCLGPAPEEVQLNRTRLWFWKEETMRFYFHHGRKRVGLRRTCSLTQNHGPVLRVHQNRPTDHPPMHYGPFPGSVSESWKTWKVLIEDRNQRNSDDDDDDEEQPANLFGREDRLRTEPETAAARALSARCQSEDRRSGTTREKLLSAQSKFEKKFGTSSGFWISFGLKLQFGTRKVCAAGGPPAPAFTCRTAFHRSPCPTAFQPVPTAATFPQLSPVPTAFHTRPTAFLHLSHTFHPFTCPQLFHLPTAFHPFPNLTHKLSTCPTASTSFHLFDRSAVIWILIIVCGTVRGSVSILKAWTQRSHRQLKSYQVKAGTRQVKRAGTGSEGGTGRWNGGNRQVKAQGWTFGPGAREDGEQRRFWLDCSGLKPEFLTPRNVGKLQCVKDSSRQLWQRTKKRSKERSLSYHPHPPRDSTIDNVESFRFLGTIISQDLNSTPPSIESSSHPPPSPSGTSGATAKDKSRLQRSSVTEKVIGCNLPSLQERTASRTEACREDVADPHRTPVTDYFSHYPLVGVPSNLYALYHAALQLKQRNELGVYLLNLTVSDLLYQASLPLWLQYIFQDDDWRHREWLCQLCGFLLYENIYISIGFLCCISLDRYLAVVHPLRFTSLRSMKAAWMVSIIVWIKEIAVGVVFFHHKEVTRDRSNRSVCFEHYPMRSWEHPVNYYRFTIGFLLPLAILSISYLCVLRAVGRSAGTQPDQKTRIRQLVSSTILIFLVCFSPYHVFLLVRTLFERDCSFITGIFNYYHLSLLLTTLNCVADPALYCFVSEGARRGLYRVLVRPLSKIIFCCCRRGNASPINPASESHEVATEENNGHPTVTLLNHTSRQNADGDVIPLSVRKDSCPQGGDGRSSCVVGVEEDTTRGAAEGMGR
ncbi:LOW QUALITY PROTEIN: uncharacterized protein LOC119779244, partial [Cyprinodon tularosa]|uniref:LOW QUALITY PROTEIN: uncharacterized protein LOC119779244 n=1 Tax=Cyprinodon tularosa TaxID=77115 RepID=UPI0018E23218